MSVFGTSKRSATTVQLQRCSTARRAARPSSAPVVSASAARGSRRAARAARPASPAGKERSAAALRADLLADAGRHLGEARVRGDDREHAGRRRLGRDHAERLGEDRRHDGDVAERQQMPEVAVLERPGEERAERSERLELLAEVAEADDDRARVEAGDRLEQHLDALVLDQLPEVDDRRPFLGEEAGEALGVALVGKPLLAVARVRRIGSRLLEQRGERLLARLGPELVHVDARRHDLDAVDVADDLLEHVADVLGARVDDLRAGERLGAPPRRGRGGRASRTRAPSRAP